MTEKKIEGLVVKSLGGFYYVKDKDNNEYECRARGLFRNKNIKIVVGDYVSADIQEEGNGYILDIVPRKNQLVRPPLANIDVLVLVNSVVDPKPNLLVLDELIAIAEYNNIEPIIVFTKIDRQDPKEYEEIYREAGFKVFCVNNKTCEGTLQLKEELRGKISAFSGNSGVGKSSLLNAINSTFNIKTGDTSQKLGRGKHTTRHVELFPLDNSGYIADTPGFSSIETQRFEIIFKEELQNCFREFEPYIDGCKFTGCSHTKEKGCKVLEALEEGKISSSRHNSYVKMYEEARNIKEWEHKK
ncbi:MAG: ribosome small subunit-dependent GTPase A [Oscillospiraceae bacterium]